MSFDDQEIIVITLDDVMKYAPGIARRLKYSGLRAGSRNLEQMQQMFEKIPSSYRVGNEFEKTLLTIETWLSTRHGSHIKSYHHGGSGNPQNIIFEDKIKNWQRGAKDMLIRELISIKYDNLIDNIFHAIDNGRNAIYRDMPVDAGELTPTLSEMFYDIGTAGISLREGVDRILSKYSYVKYLPNDVATFSMIMVASLIPITAEPLAKVASLDDYVFFEDYINSFLNIADNYSDEILHLLKDYDSDDIKQLESSFVY